MIQSESEVLIALQQSLVTELRSHNVELKKSWKQDDGKKISAFSNRLSGSGFLIVGVNDDGTLSGESEKWARQTEEEMSQHINRLLDPVTAVHFIHAHQIAESWILVVEYRNPGSVVYWNKKSYKGSGTSICEMEPHEIMELTIKLPGLKDYTAQNAAWDDTVFTKALLSIFRTDLNTKSEQNINMFAEMDGVLENIGILGRRVCNILFGSCRYRMIFYNKDGVPERNEVRQGLYGLISPATVFEIQQHAKVPESAGEAFPNKALNESMANAVAHSAYFENDGEIIVECFNDRVSISNLCMPESAYFANKWFSRAHKTYNKLLVETLRFCKKVDELGRGKNLIYSESIVNGKPPPLVDVEQAGRYSRWKLTLFGGPGDAKRQRLYNQLFDLYHDKNMALMGCALTGWSGKKLAEIKQYLDGESSVLLSRIFASDGGPVYYSPSQDLIFVKRWARTILADGVASKGLDFWEKEAYFNYAYKWATEKGNGTLTTRSVRRMIGLGRSSPENTMLSKLFREWIEEQKIKRVKPGVFKVIKNDEKILTESDFKRLLSERVEEGHA